MKLDEVSQLFARPHVERLLLDDERFAALLEPEEEAAHAPVIPLVDLVRTEAAAAEARLLEAQCALYMAG